MYFYLRAKKSDGTRRIHESMKNWGLPQEAFSEKETGNPFVLVTLRTTPRANAIIAICQSMLNKKRISLLRTTEDTKHK
jgi:hypothetical protein